MSDITPDAVIILADLKVQAMMFDMDIDIEALSLEPKRSDNTPIWVRRWREKLDQADFDQQFDIDWE